MDYKHLIIEKKWQNYWEENKTFKTLDNNKPKFYCLDMFPYPSGAGLHIGHPEGYTATDIISRFKRMQGYNVLHPMGFDAFGLPAEQYALETGNHPQKFTEANIANYKKQLKSLGFSFDWDREINTSDPKYYKWTQWIFLKLYEKGLAEIKDVEVNWCEGLGTVLANEELEIIDGIMVSERGKHPVIKKPMRQWVLKITHYAEELLKGLDNIDMPNSIKEMQKNWIGKSIGATVKFTIKGSDDSFNIFTTRPDTIFGATYCVLSPEHPLVLSIVDESCKEDVLNYIEKTKMKTDLERTELNKEKTGVFTGAYAINPVSCEEIPIWIADYVLASYGHGAIMAVPAHDERDFEFASKFNLEIKSIINCAELPFIKDGEHINSDFLNGLNNEEAIKKMNEYLKENNLGEETVTYRLRDWIFSRQRYWGEPFPVIIWDDGVIECLENDKLPLELPVMEKITLSKTGESPLANATDWLNVVRSDGVKGRRETNTMPQWAGSCWYYIAYIIKNDENYLDLNDSKTWDLINKWLPIDLYIGGAEHAVSHLLYSRFWHKVLYDCGLLKENEPYKKLFNQGMILGANGEKMSKSLGNVINPDDIVAEYGADALRVYEMFMGPLDQTKPWSPTGLEGPRRFLDRVYRLYSEVAVIIEETANPDFEKIYHQTIKKVTEDYEVLRFNTAISQMMIFINECYKEKQVPLEYLEGFLKLLNPIAPHITEELNLEVLNHKNSLAYQAWPIYDEEKLKEEKTVIIIQVNGKIREKIEVNINESEDTIKEKAFALDKIKQTLEGSGIKKVVYVKNKLLNIVI